MRLGLVTGYSGPRMQSTVDLILEAERLGFDSVWSGEAYGSDVITFLAYVGARTTGTGAGDFLISGPAWKGSVSQGMTPIAAPHNAALVIGRVFVESDRDLPTAYGLAQQIQLTPLSH